MPMVQTMLDQLPPTHVCLHFCVSCVPCLGGHSPQACSIMLSPSSFSPQSVQGSHTKAIYCLWSLLEVMLHFQCHRTLCPLSLCPLFSRKVCSVFLNSVKFFDGFELSCIKKFSYLIGRPLKTKALQRVSETASPASCSLLSNSSPLMTHCPNLQNLRAAIKLTVPTKSQQSTSPQR